MQKSIHLTRLGVAVIAVLVLSGCQRFQPSTPVKPVPTPQSGSCFSASLCPVIQYTCAEGFESFYDPANIECACGCRPAAGTAGTADRPRDTGVTREQACPSPGPACPSPQIPSCQNGRWICIGPAETGVGSASGGITAGGGSDSGAESQGTGQAAD